MAEASSLVYTARGPADDENWTAVADALNERMRRRRVGQQRLAELSGVSVSTVRLVQSGEPGRRVQNKTLEALARALDWPDNHLIDLLLAETDAPTATPTVDDPIMAGIERIERRLDGLARQLATVERLAEHAAGSRNG
jgi:transcriptional regulator with XRE-family HTH domain